MAMNDEEKVKQELETRFESLKDEVSVKRARRIFVEVKSDFDSVYDFARTELGFYIVTTITGLDAGDHFEAIYHLARPEGMVLNLKRWIGKDKPEIKSISDTYPAVDIYERELVDTLGIQVTGLKPGPRYPLPDGWPEGEYPMRKDWAGEFSGGKKGAGDVQNG
jgi:Ni,Fe-hydrogenase III component G